MEKRKLANSELVRKSVSEFKEARKTPLIVILDNVRSLNNIGSIFRTCDAFLIQKIYLCGITATPPHKDINKTALGATDTVSWEHAENAIECGSDHGAVRILVKQMRKRPAAAETATGRPVRPIQSGRHSRNRATATVSHHQGPGSGQPER